MDVALQSKLLRVLQDHRVRPLGSTEDFLCDVRIIAATNQHIEKAVTQGTLRSALYYRLNVIPIELDPLRDRLGGLPLRVLTESKQASLQQHPGTHGLKRTNPLERDEP